MWPRPHRISPALYIIPLIFLFTPLCMADAPSLPLEGYFHPGRTVPVRCSGSCEVYTAGGIASQITSAGIVPLWIVDPQSTEIQWSSPTGSGKISNLHPLADTDFLVGSVVGGDLPLNQIFPGRRAILVHIDPADLIACPLGWESLDGLILSTGQWHQIPASAREDFFAEGIAIAAQGPRPDNSLPWKQAGSWWVLEPHIAPLPMVVENVNDPLAGEVIGRDASYRRRIVLLGAIYGLVACGVALWRSRWMLAVFVAVSLGAAVFFFADDSHQSPIFRKSGTVYLADDISMRDAWTWEVSHRPVNFQFSVSGIFQAVFSDESLIPRMNLILRCDATAKLFSLDGTLPADEPLAIVERKIAAIPSDISRSGEISSPLRDLAQTAIYPGDFPAGQAQSASSTDWPAVLFTGR